MSGFSSAFSNFMSTFGGTSPTTDLMSLASNAISCNSSLGSNHTITYSGRYICIGNLLIQFTDFSEGYPGQLLNGNGVATVYFPISYDTAPYYIIANPCIANGAQSTSIPEFVVGAYNPGYFTGNCVWNSYGSCLSYLAIGPKPAIFNSYNVIYVTYATVTPYSNTYSGTTYYGLIIQTNNIPGGTSGNVTLNFTANINAYMLVVGGGGGGGGNGSTTVSSENSGGGGGGGTFYCHTSSPMNISGNSTVTIQVGTGGAGGSGNGGSGNLSSVSYTDTNYGPNTITATGGGGGGSGNATGGNGGGTTQISAFNNYGGGGGGGSGNTTSGSGGNNDSNLNGNSSKGGYSYFTFANNIPQLPFYNGGDVNVGGGGGGSGGTYGGNPGVGAGGYTNGYTNNSNGASASNVLPSSSSSAGYFGGGGGGGIANSNGGNGGNGVVMIWWQA